ncbi:MAG: hypothetical protein K6T91_04225 [Firmicutes bacterium]|nr:hypothetical protein [Bacillota bacterium]
MNRFFEKVRSMKMGHLIMGAVALTLIPILIEGSATVIGVMSVGSRTKNFQNNARVMQNLDELRYTFQNYRISVYQMLYMMDNSRLEELNRLNSEMDRLIGEMKKSGVDAESIADIEAKRTAYMAEVKPILDNYTNKDYVLTLIPKAISAQNEYMSTLDAMEKRVDSSEKKASQDVQDSVSNLVRTITLSVILTAIIVIIVAFLIQRVIIVPLRESFSKLGEMSRSLALSSQELLNNANEISQATSQITTTIGQVAAGAGEQSRNASEVESLVGQISNIINQVAVGAQTQATSVADTAASVNQLIESINKVSESSHMVAEVVDSTSTTAERGKSAVGETVTGMQRIKDTVLDSANKIQTLGEKSKQIGEIIEVIDDIAEQTNLLALNAAIEAARAGEHGKGFAVVADEVRKLAERSARATGEIAELIKGIQDETMQAVEAMQRGTSEVEAGSELAHHAGTAIEEMMASIRQVIMQIASVSESAEQMAFASNQVSQAIDQIAAISQENSASAEEVASSTGSLVNAVSSIAASAEESAASAEEVSATSEEQAASVQEIAAKVQTLASMSDELDKMVASFKL